MDWIVAGAQIVAAVATVALGYLTYRLAKGTESMATAVSDQVKASQAQVEASREQAALTREALSGSVRPILAGFPRGIDAHPSDLVVWPDTSPLRLDDGGDIVATADLCTVPLRNVGPGIAFVDSYTLEGWGEPHWRRKCSSGVIPSGNKARFTFFSPTRLAPESPKPARVTLVVSYRDVENTGLTTKVDLVRSTGGVMVVNRVSLFSEGETEPFAVSPSGERRSSEELG